MSINRAGTASGREGKLRKEVVPTKGEVHDARVGSCVEGVGSDDDRYPEKEPSTKDNRPVMTAP